MQTQSPHVRNIALDLILTLLTCFIFNLYVQYRQCLALNDMLKQDKYSFWLWLILTIITCGFYHIYHEYRMSADLCKVLKKSGEQLTIVSVFLTFFGFSIVLDAIQQSEINSYYGHHQL